ncbi:alpha/beta hydrolase family protein [Microbispora hainanensis]|uniref:Prolyl oligopeptidase family serine peptidase n=1 Tax=Microbispora hainanensis TaxID=568844 RepID=A0A544YUQ6_9ACTN|nr:prolyl oligopeptidase family serine peptidase [Microbispora hainanensis]TQS20242.1 prolyl oligopeptidase family serine peptidase [Microbispora hainanensis]
MRRIALAIGLALTLTAAPAAAAGPPSATAAAAAPPSPAIGEAVAVPADLTGRDVSFAGSGGLTLHGTVLSQAKAAPGRPGMVLVHGAGTGTPRTKLMGEAVAFARTGMSVLVYDKRSEGYSTFHRSYSALADDALGAVAALRSQPGVDPAKVGVWGLSEGGWVAPLAASRSRDVAFVVVVGANALPPLRQQTWAVAAGLRKAGVAGSLVDRTEPALYRAIADGGLFPEPWYDPEPALAAVRQPVLAVWGVHDLLTPPEETPPIFARALEKGGNRHYTFRFFPGADHAAHLTPDGGVTRLPALAPGYADLVGSWVREVVAGRPPLASVSGPAPEQASSTVPVDRPAPWESATVQLAAMLLLIAAFAAYPVTALVRRLRGRARTAPPAAPRVVSAAGLVAVLGSFAFLFYLLMTGGKLAAPGPVLLGRPVVWLALQALALTTVAASVRTVLAWRRAGTRGERLRLGLLLGGGALFLPWALYWGLLLP